MSQTKLINTLIRDNKLIHAYTMAIDNDYTGFKRIIESTLNARFNVSRITDYMDSIIDYCQYYGYKPDFDLVYAIGLQELSAYYAKRQLNERDCIEGIYDIEYTVKVIGVQELARENWIAYASVMGLMD